MSAEPGARGDDAESYARTLRTVLDTESERVAAALGDLHRAAVEAENGVEAILIDVFVDQDGEGPFDVWARFEGLTPSRWTDVLMSSAICSGSSGPRTAGSPRYPRARAGGRGIAWRKPSSSSSPSGSKASSPRTRRRASSGSARRTSATPDRARVAANGPSVRRAVITSGYE